MNWLKQNYLYLIGGVIGAIIGYIYWSYKVCNSEACALNSTPFPMTINFALLGAIALNFLKPLLSKTK